MFEYSSIFHYAPSAPDIDQSPPFGRYLTYGSQCKLYYLESNPIQFTTGMNSYREEVVLLPLAYASHSALFLISRRPDDTHASALRSPFRERLDSTFFVAHSPTSAFPSASSFISSLRNRWDYYIFARCSADL